jgi:2-keto-4-pentenoate hydratase
VRQLLGPDNIAAAYAAQASNTARWMAQGRRIVGRKIGLTARAVQAQLGVDQPDFGMLFSDMAIGDGGEIARGTVLQPRVEAEVALILDRDLSYERPTVADVIRATVYAVPALEIVDSRIANWDIGIVDTIADNASAGLFVLGGPVRRLDGLDLVTCRMQLLNESMEVSAGSGSACLGSPLNAAVWLAGRMAALGEPLRAGDTILTGALGPMAAASAPASFAASIEGIGSVRVRFL